MKCANCGAELKADCIYCSVCGHEVQIVPDYNILEDDYLKTILAGKEQQKTLQKLKRQKAKKRNYLFPVLLTVAVVCVTAALIAAALVQKQRRNSFDYQYAHGIRAEQGGDHEGALTYLQRALELEEDNLPVMMDMARIYMNKQDETSEEAMLLQMLLIDAENEEACKMLVDLYRSQKKYDKITELYERFRDTPLKSLFDDYLVDTPKFEQSEGVYEDEMEVEITAKDGCSIYYSFGDTNPIEAGRVYESAIPITEGETVIHAVAKDEHGIYSDVVTARYQVKFVAPDAPTVTPASGSYTSPQMIAVTIPQNCNVYYTWDGTTPTGNSARYDGAIEMPTGNNVLTLVAINQHGLSSKVVKYNYIYLP